MQCDTADRNNFQLHYTHNDIQGDIKTEQEGDERERVQYMDSMVKSQSKTIVTNIQGD